ncbi:hypothetical protein DM01DRAFT_1410809 [Hesseltinella vesiculosa]|uniref:Protein BIG1 n=1 Tax=Hesseltinella vesiculosa TaxID=101127 RepID=A0A1X2G5V0_9FUNG|nr:hypothetical protein DM01DRAFT_1410809 [Hesseltinella vesiculosa]
MKVTLALLTTFISAAFAFEETAPCLLWASKQGYLSTTKADQLVLQQHEGMDSVLKSLSSNVCNSQRIAVIDQLGLHRADLPKLDSLKTEYLTSAASTHYEYIAGGVPARDLAQVLANQCSHGDLSTVDPADFSNMDTKVLLMTMSGSVQDSEPKLQTFFGQLQKHSNNDYVVIYTSSQPKPSTSTLQQRAPNDPPVTNTSIFEKYQLFSPAIFMSLAIMFLFVFIAGVGITWLLGIQTPTHTESKPKKN